MFHRHEGPRQLLLDEGVSRLGEAKHDESRGKDHLSLLQEHRGVWRRRQRRQPASGQ
ncbi:hypothetical protein EMIHUDRAFT_368351, partial [Emiliania huxleyi CCMP1516]|uniref:Uncharacterized protein n=2 Tax=Emiliania huxleyi TaxID=2903 RepID=A0A0D3JGB9_EMIH1